MRPERKQTANGRNIPTIDSLELLTENYDAFLFDAYGVLFDGKGPIAGAVKAWTELKAKGKPCWILTNGSSRTLAETCEHYKSLGLNLESDEVINSASLLPSYFAEKDLAGLACAVLGTKGSESYVKQAGGRIVDPLSDADYSVVVVANQTEYPLLETLDAVLSHAITRFERDEPLHLILTNPDLIYPHAKRRFGLTAGSLALVLEAALKARLGDMAPSFEKLGKPYPRIFAEAIKRAGSSRLLMIGDQLETDIRGASNCGMDSVLVGTGLVRVDHWKPGPLDPKPSFILPEWRTD